MKDETRRPAEMVERIRAIGAGNVHARRPVIEMRLAATARITLAPEAVERLFASILPMREEVLDFPALHRLKSATREVPGSAAIEVLAVIAQRYMNWPVRFCAWRPSGDDSRAVFEAGTPRVGKHAGRMAAELLQAFVESGQGAGLEAVFHDKLAQLAKKVGRETPSLDALRVAHIAAARDIPWSPIPGSSYLRLGWGRHARMLIGSETSNTSSIARRLTQRKRLASGILRTAGLPMPDQKSVRRAEDAVAAASKLGFPVVIKPAKGNMGRGVSVGVVDEAGVAAAFDRARKISPTVLVEAMIVGEEYRLLVVDRKFVAAARRRPAQVRGDGIRTLYELVARENARPERETILPGWMATRVPIEMDSEARALIAEQGHAGDTIPALGEVVLLRRVSNVSRGGDSVDETHRIHPSIRTLAERASTALGVDVCGVDFISSDIGRPWWETGAAICETNIRPGLSLHSCVSEGTRRDVEADVLRMLFPVGTPARVPIIAVLEHVDAAPLIGAVATAAAQAGRRLGIACRPERRAALGATVRHLDGPSAVLWDESIDIALVEVAAKDVAQRGLGLDRIDLAILPPSNKSSSVVRAETALVRAARRQMVSLQDTEAIPRALSALGLWAGPGTPRPAAVLAPPKTSAQGSFRLLMVGDIGFGESYMQHRRAAALHHGLGTLDYGRCFAGLNRLLASADMVVGNLEAPLCGRTDPGLVGRKKYLGWSDAEPAAQAIKHAGFQAVSLGNNHSLDCGGSGLAETIARLDACGIMSFGAGDNLDAAGRPLVVSFEVAGVARSLVVFGSFEHRRRYDRYNWYARPGRSGVARLSAKEIGASIAALRKKLPAPIFVAYPHWGTDYKAVTDRQRALAADLVKAGVDLVIGHGTHTVQSIEMVGGRPVLYGIGNFVWNTPGRFGKLDARPYGAAVTIEIGAGQTDPIALRVYPLLTDNSMTGFQTRPVTAAEFAEAARELTVGLNHPPRTGIDAIGHHLEILPTSPPNHVHRTAPMPIPPADMAAPVPDAKPSVAQTEIELFLEPTR